MDHTAWRPVAEKLFADIRALSFDGIGITRDSYGDKENACADALREWHNERSGKTQRVAALQFVSELPRSAIGKVLKRELRDLHRPAR